MYICTCVCTYVCMRVHMHVYLYAHTLNTVFFRVIPTRPSPIEIKHKV